MGRSRGGLSTKIHLAVDGRGRPVRVILTGGQRNDITQAVALLAGLRCRYVLADKGYDSRELIEQIQAQGSQPVIPPRTCQKPRFYDKARYRLRNVIERCFSRLKQYRRIAPDTIANQPTFSHSSTSPLSPAGCNECRFSLGKTPVDLCSLPGHHIIITT